MPYTYSTIAPTPAWITVNSATGLVTVDKLNAPIGGYIGIARFRVSDGTNSATVDAPIDIRAKYAVTTEYKELLTHRWAAKAVSRSRDSGPLTYFRWLATASSRAKDVSPAISAPEGRLVRFQRQFEAVASLPPIIRSAQLDRSIAPESGAFSPAIASLGGTAGLTALTGGIISVKFPFPFDFGFGSSSTSSISIFQGRLFFDASSNLQWLEVNNTPSASFINAYGGGDANKYRIRYEARTTAGGTPVIWEATFFREGVIQVATGALGANTGNNSIRPVLTPISFVSNSSVVINYIRSGQTVNYLVRQGSYTV